MSDSNNSTTASTAPNNTAQDMTYSAASPDQERQYKLIWYAPEADVETTKLATFAAGAGGIGTYEQCCWMTKGMGQFKPNTGSNPTIGEVGLLETVEEWRIEVLVPHSKVRGAVKALIDAHSYEEPAYEVVRVRTLNDFDE